MNLSTCVQCWCTPCQCYYRNTLTYITAPTTLTTICYGNFHYFACKHEAKCACGQVERVVEAKSA